jgi:hypothetical protein
VTGLALGHCSYVLCANGKLPTCYFSVQKINKPFDVYRSGTKRVLNSPSHISSQITGHY